ncbi:hypothetical protein ABFS82_10G020800 [Erythranthe guttata]|uniref:FBD-associated F-box protein At4g10400-like n=1 Tax=Erythranthe guttata TaxID=4155 RepID=UPI00064D9DE7|nr:PREDICTED: FBD-associated F-box protein At4g10400-like [Erythranthe guttata]|eukprot:XP_012832125.1 PREDICTED: FBD-associated F-box protein At4g10400-like [Erythranthe guttata]
MARKRLGFDSKFQLNKCNKRSKRDNNRISWLPDDILVNILSYLSMKEAARTTVLSSRWMNLWKHTTSSLDFRADNALARIRENYDLCSEERRKYEEWVDRVIRSHKSVTLKEFSVCFDLGLSSQESITRWIEFAFTRHVQKLDLDFSVKVKNKTSPRTHYTLPEEFLTRRTSGGNSCIDFKSLKELSLKCVNLTGQAIEFFLHNCPFLEKLVVHYTNKISNLEVCGPSLVLKHLELMHCNYLESVKVSAPNLISLIGPNIDVLLLENVPMLKEVYINCMHYNDSVEKLLPTYSCCVSQLEILTLQLNSHRKLGLGMHLTKVVLPTFPELTKLKKLVVSYWTDHDQSLMGLTPLIRASPNLQEFILELWMDDPSRSHRKVKNTTSQLPHHHLKVFKFCGYYGRSSDVELVRYILKNSVVLEKIIIDPFEPILRDFELCGEDLERIQIARGFAKQQLEARVPQRVELVIL